MNGFEDEDEDGDAAAAASDDDDDDGSEDEDDEGEDIIEKNEIWEEGFREGKLNRVVDLFSVFIFFKFREKVTDGFALLNACFNVKWHFYPYLVLIS